MKISKYKNLGQGWNGESVRHSNAKKFGLAGGLYAKNDYRGLKISIKKYPEIRKSVLDIKKIINKDGVNNVFKPMDDEFQGKYGVSRKINGKNVRYWNKNNELQICCYNINGEDYQVYTFLDKSVYNIHKIDYVEVISSIPRKLTPKWK
jgi:hypothetical protein